MAGIINAIFNNRRNNKLNECDYVIKSDACRKKYIKMWIVERAKKNINNVKFNKQNATC